MNRRTLLWHAKAFAALIFLCGGPALAQSAADVVFTNGRIYTVDDGKPYAEAVAVKDGKFAEVGSAHDVEKFVGSKTRVVDLDGAFVTPGFIDAHIHPAQPYLHEEGGALLFPETYGEKQIADAVAAYLKKNPTAPYLFGEKWPVTLFPDRHPTKAWLDSLVSDRPAVLRDETRHGAVVNTRMLELAGITRDTPQPKYGFIEKDSKTGEPTGYLAETAQQAVFSKLPMYPDEVWERAMKRAMRQLTAWGVTGYNDASTNAPQLRVYRKMDREGTLNMHVSASIAMNDWAKDRVVDPEPLVATAGEYRTPLFDPVGRKWWGDGTPLSKTSLMVGEYADGGHGTMSVDQADFDRMIEEARKGALVRVHAFGDGSVRAILDVFEQVRKRYPQSISQVHQISHTAFLRDEDIPRFRELNIVADFSPVIYYRSPQMSVLEHAVGPDSMKYFANIRKTIDSGAHVAIGSDWPTGAIDANPLRMLQVLVTRRNPYEKTADEPLGEPISLEDGIRVMTLGGAYSMRKEHELGSIEKGKSADMVVLDRDLFAIDPGAIVDTRVVYTILRGKIVYDSGLRKRMVTRATASPRK